jgi:membrane protein DedA with SNARE-associated domain
MLVPRPPPASRVSVLAGIVDGVEGLVDGAGWLGLTAAMAVEGVFPPVPSEVVLPLAGAEVASGALSFLVALLAATAGSVVGAWALYAVGRSGGRPAVLRLGPLVRLDAARLLRAEAWFARQGDLMVLLGRLVPGVRALVSVPAGMARMPVWRFTLLTAVGSLAWNAGLIELGASLAARWTEIAGVAAPAAIGLLVALAASLPAVWLWHRALAERTAVR